MSALDELLDNVDYSAFGFTKGLLMAKLATKELAQLRAALAEKDAELAEAREVIERIAQPYLYSNESGYFGADAIHYRHIANNFLAAHPAEPKP
jgi:hypothetical protein